METIEWLEQLLVNKREHHDHHLARPSLPKYRVHAYRRYRLWYHSALPGNYDDYMIAAEQAKERVRNENAKKKAQIAELQSFVSRFSANASKAKQATSRQKQLEKIQLIEVKPSSRMNPYIRFEQNKKLHKHAVQISNIAKGFDGESLFAKLTLGVQAGERIAVIGRNGVGKDHIAQLPFWNHTRGRRRDQMGQKCRDWVFPSRSQRRVCAGHELV